MGLYEFTEKFIALSTGRYFAFQFITLLVLMLCGMIVVASLKGEKLSFFDILLAYPLSLCLYSLSGYFLLSAGIPFNKKSIIVVLLILAGLTVILFRENLKRLFQSRKITVRKAAVTSGAIIAAALICTSGILSVSVTNDSMYFFSEYPRALIYYGKLTSLLDNFLTDASQGIAIIGTIPFFFGFDEIFGIQSFLNVNFIMIFVYSCYETAKDRITDSGKISKIIAVLAAVILLTAMPYYVMSKWMMANMFYMEYMFITVYLAGRIAGQRDITKGNLMILSVLITGLSIMRMEGAIYAGFIVLCIMTLDYSNRDIASYLIAPMLILQSMYLYRIFFILTLHTSIQFMTKEKAVILIVFLAAILLYVLIIRNRFFKKLLTYYKWLLLSGLFLVNVMILFVDKGDYVTNLIAIKNNLTRNSGWGLFVSMIIGILILVPKKSMQINFIDITVISYILLAIATVWARGDSLYESFGDSGNRVLIQVVPIVLYAVMVKVVEGIEFWRKEELN